MKSVEFLLPQHVVSLSKSFVIVCEGFGDVRLVCALLKHRRINQFEVGCSSRAFAEDKAVKDSIGGYLKGIKLVDTIHPILRGVLVIRDANDDPNTHFREVADALTDAGFPTPKIPFNVEGGAFRVGVFLVPGRGRNGTLEHLLFEAACANKPQIEPCVDTFLGCMNDGRPRTPNQIAKMKMSTTVATVMQEQSLGFVRTCLGRRRQSHPNRKRLFR